jgi:hypothetical protein
LRSPPAKPYTESHTWVKLLASRKIAEREAALFLAEQARGYLDCAINLCATSMSIPALIRLLEDHTELLREFG